MGKSSLLKSSLLPVVAFLIFSGAQTDTYGQAGFYFGKQINFDYKWSVAQKWDDLTGDWNDTLALSYTISVANGKPSEIITLSHDDSSFGVLREVITYNGDKIANTAAYIKDSLSGEYQKAPLYTQTFWYSGDNLLKHEIALQFSEDSDVKFHSETRFRLDNQRITADSSFTKISGTIEDLIGSKVMYRKILPGYFLAEMNIVIRETAL